MSEGEGKNSPYTAQITSRSLSLTSTSTLSNGILPAVLRLRAAPCGN